MIFKPKSNIIATIMQKTRKFKLPTAAIVALSFLGLIFLGTALLCIPAATKSGEVSFLTSLFTATSAACVTGLVTVDVFTHFSGFGQAVILVLIQIGGLGFITILSLFLLYVKKHTSLTQRKLVMQSAGSVDLGSVKNLVLIILIGTAIFEFAGAFALSFAFVPVYGWGLGIWQAIFTAISAFCNAGFTLTGANGASSLCEFVGNPVVMITVMVLIVIGGLGFFVWGDVVHHGVHVKKYSFHAKIVLTATLTLIIVPWALFMAFEWNGAALEGKGAGTKVLATLFMAVTPRTAGFASIDYAEMSAAGKVLTNVLMFIGGSPGSTAGGIKTTTVVVFVLSMIATARRSEEVHLFNRRFEKEAGAQASAIICLYMLVVFATAMIICGVEGNKVGFDDAVFEVISAVGTVGLTTGITPQLHAVSKVVLILLMFFGRIGGFTLVLVFSGENKPVTMGRVPEHIIVG